MVAKLHRTADSESEVVESATAADADAQQAIEKAAGKLADKLSVDWQHQ
jgi:hypothetical protein